MAVGQPYGATVAFGTSGFAANIIGTIDWSAIERAAIETTHFGTAQATAARTIGTKTFVPSKHVNPGELSLEIQYNPTLDIPIGSNDAAEVITLTPPSDMASNPITLSGFIRSARIGMPLEGLATATITIKLTGPQTTPTT